MQTNTLGVIIALIALHFFKNDSLAISLVMIIVILISLKLKIEETLSLTLVTVLMRTTISNEMIEKSFQNQLKQLESDILRLEEQYKLFNEEREIRKHIFYGIQI